MNTAQTIRRVEKSWGRYVDGKCVNAIQLPQEVKPFERWGYDYASCIDVYEAADGTIVAECQGRECNGYEARHHRIRVANRQSWSAFKAETGTDREWHLPNTDPRSRAWEFINLDKT